MAVVSHRILVGLGLAAALAIGVAVSPAQEKGKEPEKKAAPPSAEAVKFFETKIRPVLAENCFKCHGETKQRGKLRLDGLQHVLTGGEIGPAIVPGHPEKSLLIK